MLEDRVLSLNELLGVVILRKNAFDQRLHMGHACLGLGLTVPARRDKYLPLDLVALLLTSQLSLGVGSLRTATDAVRTHWIKWLALVQRAERDFNPDKAADPLEQLFFAVTVTDGHPRAYNDINQRVAVGTMAQVLEDFGTDVNIFGVPMSLTLRLLRRNARRAGVELPSALTVQPDDPRHGQWWKEIGAYREAALARATAKASRRNSQEKEPA